MIGSSNAVIAGTSDILNTTIVSDETNVANLLKQQFINYDSVILPDTFDFNISVATADNLFSYWGFKNLKVSGEITNENAQMNSMFYQCPSLTSIDLSGLNLSNVTSMNATFMFCSNLLTVNFGEQTIPNLKYGNQMFQRCTSLTNIDLSSCNITLTDAFYYVFSDCSQLEVANLGGFNTSQLRNCRDIFSGCRNLQYVNLSGWTTEALTNSQNMFRYDSSIIAVVIDSPAVFRITSTSAFSTSSIKNGGTGFVYVPDNLVDEYKSATNWTTVADQIKPLSELPQEVKDVFGME